MKRWLSHLFIGAYLFALFGGVFSHAVGYKNSAHPMMYFVVWDMFCGWGAYSTRIHIVAEGESGRYYELAPGPWGEFKPFGRLGRRHYDTAGIHTGRMAVNCLRHTRHEPIIRFFVVEESWAKKYNLPDEIWQQQYREPKDLYSYFQVLHVLTGDGTWIESRPSWITRQVQLSVMDNPRLRADLYRGRPMFAPSTRDRLPAGTLPMQIHGPSPNAQAGSLLGH